MLIYICHFLVSSNEKVKIKTGNYEIANTKRENFSRVHLDRELSFDHHLVEI